MNSCVSGRLSRSIRLVILSLAIALTASAAFAASPPTAGLVAWYSFDQTCADSSGHGHNGTAYNGAAPAADRFGNPDGAYGFNGANSYVQIPDSSAFEFAGKAFSISAWFEMTGPFYGSAGFGTIFDRSHAGYADGYRLDYSPWSGTFRIIGNPILSIDAALSTGVWYHVVAVSDGAGTGAIYLNGAEIGWGSYATSPYSTTPRIGDCQLIGQAPFDGLVDDVRIYNRALTPDEILALYEEADPVHRYLDDAGRSSLCVDSITGAWQYSVLKGPGAGLTFEGSGTFTSTPDGQQLRSPASVVYQTMLAKIAPGGRSAQASFRCPSKGINSALYDSNALDDPPGCQ